MKNNKVINFNKFMDGSFKNEPTNAQKMVIHFKKNKKVYIRVGLVATSLCLSAIHPAFATSGLDSGIDETGREIYKELLSIGRWVICIKGGWDVIRATLGNDYAKAKKDFISYVLAYVFLLILPAAMDKADGIIKHINMAGGN